MSGGEVTLTFTRDDDEQVSDWHYWVVVPADWSKNYALCARGPGQMKGWGEERAPVGITTVPADVTCHDCLEWMHA